MAKIIAFANYKGGTAKTTTAHNVGAALTIKGRKVLLIDFDPQSNLTGCLLSPREGAKITATVFEAMTARPTGSLPLPVLHVRPSLDLVPCSLKHSGTETLISSRPDKATILKQLVEPLRGKYDFIMIDCPPTPGILTANALAASDRVVIPIEAQALPMKGITQVLQMVEVIRAQFNPSLSLGGIAITRWKANNLSKITEGMLRQTYEKVFETKINESVQIATAPAFFRSIFEHAPKSRGAAQYMALAEEIEAIE